MTAMLRERPVEQALQQIHRVAARVHHVPVGDADVHLVGQVQHAGLVHPFHEPLVRLRREVHEDLHAMQARGEHGDDDLAGRELLVRDLRAEGEPRAADLARRERHDVRVDGRVAAAVHDEPVLLHVEAGRRAALDRLLPEHTALVTSASRGLACAAAGCGGRPVDRGIVRQRGPGVDEGQDLARLLLVETVALPPSSRKGFETGCGYRSPVIPILTFLKYRLLFVMSSLMLPPVGFPSPCSERKEYIVLPTM